MRAHIALFMFAALAPAGTSQTRIELLNQPDNDGLFIEDGVAGLQYIYDVYIPSGGSGAFQIGGLNGPLGIEGTFRASDCAWWRSPVGAPQFQSLWQAWYSSSVEPSFSAFWNDPAAVGVQSTNVWHFNHNHDTGASGIGPLFPPGPVEWAMDNIWHVPTDYGPTSEYFFPGPGFGAQATGDTGAAYHAVTGIFIGGALALQATIRVVAPYLPDEINWYIDAPLSGKAEGPNGTPIFHLDADVPSISASAGGQQTLDLYAPRSRAGNLYLLLASASGTFPGFVLDSVPIPLNPDAFTLAALQIPNTQTYGNTLGFLESDGNVQMNITVPPGIAPPAIVGAQLHHASVVIDVLSSPAFTVGASNAQGLSFTP